MTEKVQSFNLITDFSEIESRQNYVEKFTIKRGEQVEAILKDLIGYYLFKEQVKCGISSCGTKHQKGYIASLQNGKEIIIGHNCGKRYFGMSFDEKSNQFEHLRNNAYQYSVVKERFQQLDELKAKYDQILNKSGKLGFVKIKQAISDFQGVAFDYYMRKVIQKEVSYNGVIRKEEFKTIEEMEAEHYMKNGRGGVIVRDTKQVVVATLENYYIIAEFYKAEKLRAFFDGIHRELKNPNSMQPQTIRNLAKKLREYDSNLRELKKYCSDANHFFRYENLIKIVQIFDKQKEKEVVERYARQFS